MARKPNYNYEKRQRDIAKKKKKEAKRLKKLVRSGKTDPEAEAEAPMQNQPGEA